MNFVEITDNWKRLIDYAKDRHRRNIIVEVDSLRVVTEGSDRLRAEVERLRQILRDAAASQDPECSFDHEGQCQSHYLQTADQCWVARARAELRAGREERK